MTSPQTEPSASRSRPSPGVTLAVTCAATGMLMLDIAVVNTALPQVASDLRGTFTGLQWVIDAYTVVLAAFVLTAGSIADRVGRRATFVAGMGVFTLSSLACGLAGTITQLDVARAFQGVGGAILFTTSLALLGDAFPEEKERAKALAVYGATIGASFAVGPLIGGGLTSAFSWRWIFLVNLPIGIACLYGVRRVAESRDPKPRAVDWPGQALLAAGLFAVVLGLLRANPDGWLSASCLVPLVLGAALVVAFLAVEGRAAEPMLPLDLFRDPVFTGIQVAAFAISASLFAVFVYATLYLQDILLLSPVEAGLAYLPGTVIMFVVSGMTASLTDKVPVRLLVVGGLGLVSFGLLLWVIPGATSHWWAILPGLVPSMIGAGAFNPALSAMVLENVPEGQSGLATGVMDTARQVGVAVGVAFLGALIPLTDGADGFVTGLHRAMVVAALVALVGAVASAALFKRRAV